MIRIILFIIACLTLCLHVTIWGAERFAVVDCFDQAVQNELRGYRSVFEQSPSRASALRVDHVFRGAGGRSLRVTASKREAGFCGLWVHLFDMRAKRPRYFDARDYGFLSFWVKGERGGESFHIRLADQRWITQQDSVSLGHVDDFLAGGVTTRWQEVVVPLHDRQLDLSRLGGVTLDFQSAGDFVVYIDDIGFKATAEDVSPGTITLNPPGNLSGPMSKAIWFWFTDELLQSRAHWDELFHFCKSHHVDQIWMQLPHAIETGTSDAVTGTAPSGEPSVRCAIRMQSPLRNFLRLAHQRQLEVHALDGAPEYCLQQQHEIPLSVVDAVIAFNRQGQPDERFDGIHFDNEPHLLVSWNSRPRREQILQEFLELNGECQRRVRQESHLAYGIDIPFWWQANDDETGNCLGSVTFRGVRKAASYHCIDMLDNVGVMNYRDTADGADGMMAHGRDLLAYADARRGATIFMGVETFRYENRTVWFCVGLPRREFDEIVLGDATLARCSRIDGYRLRVLDDGQYVHLGIELPGTMNHQQRIEAERALHKLAATFRLADHNAQAVHNERARLCAKRAIDTDPQWQQFQIRDIPARDEQNATAGFQAQSVMLPKVSFADNSYADFEEQTAAAVDYFRTFSSYGGLAVHFYETYRALCDKP